MRYEPADFERQVIQRSHQVPVLVDCWAPWCGPRKQLGPILEDMAARAEGRWELIKVNVDDNEELARAFNISSIPAVRLFVQGKVADEFVRNRSEREIRKFLEQAIPSPHAAALEDARRQLTLGNVTAAVHLLEPILNAEPANLEARLLPAQTLWRTQPERALELLTPIEALSELADQAEPVRTLARILIRTAGPDNLPPGKVREAFLAGATALRASNDAAAVEHFISTIEQDRNYHDGVAKAASRALFQLLGPRHPITERHFRAFSSALHA